MRVIFAFLIAGLLLGTNLAQAIEPKLKVLIFSVPWCEVCQEELPALQRSFDERLASYSDRFTVQGFIETGSRPNQKPTEQQAQAFRERLGVKFSIQPDPWHFQTFRKYFKGYGVPAAVVLDETGKVLKSFEDEDFTPDLITQYLTSVLDNPTTPRRRE